MTVDEIKTYDANELKELQKLYGKDFHLTFTCPKCNQEKWTTIVHYRNNKHDLNCRECNIKRKKLKLHGNSTFNNRKLQHETFYKKYVADKKEFDQIVIDNNLKVNSVEEAQKYAKNMYFRKYARKILVEFKCPQCQELSYMKLRSIFEKKDNVCHKCNAANNREKVFDKFGYFPGYTNESYQYDAKFFDSSWELAYWIYCKDYGMDIYRNTVAYPLENGHNCCPDFVVDGKLVEIKTDHLKSREDWKLKEKCYKQFNVKVISAVSISPYLNYIKNTYGKNYLDQFKVSI